MKRVVSIAAVVAMTTGLAACGSNSKSSNSSGSGFKTAIAFDVGGRGDHSFNDSAYAGMEAAKKKLPGMTIQTAEAVLGEGDQQRIDRLQQLAGSGVRAVVAVGYSYANAVGIVAKKYPNVKFAMIDDGSGASKGSNVDQVTFRENESSYLAGAAAAKTSKTGHIGFVGGVKIPLIEKFDAGFQAGAKKVNPKIKIDETYLTFGSDTSGFNAADKGRAAAQSMFQSGADVVFAAAGKSGDGVIEAAHSAGKWAIGVDSDQALTAPAGARGSVLTSVVKNEVGAVSDFLTKSKDGSLKGGNNVYGLKEDGVSITQTGNHLSADAKKTVADLKQQIADGKITVPTTPSGN